MSNLSNSKMHEIMMEALNDFFDLSELRAKAASKAFKEYVYNHDRVIVDMVNELLSESFETYFDEEIESAVEDWVEYY